MRGPLATIEKKKKNCSDSCLSSIPWQYRCQLDICRYKTTWNIPEFRGWNQSGSESQGVQFRVFLQWGIGRNKNLPSSVLLLPANRAGPVWPESPSLFLLTSPGHNSNKTELGIFFSADAPFVKQTCHTNSKDVLGVDGCVKSLAMKCFVFVWCTCGALLAVFEWLLL